MHLIDESFQVNILLHLQGYTKGIVGTIVSEEDKNTSAVCSTLYDDSVIVSDNVGTLILNFLEGSVSSKKYFHCFKKQRKSRIRSSVLTFYIYTARCI